MKSRAQSSEQSSEQVYVIAEAGTGHDASLQKAYRLIEAASASGANAIKFQHVIADEIVHSSVGRIKLPNGMVDLYAKFKALEVSFDFLKKLKLKCKKMGITFLCSVFGIKSLSHLQTLGVSAYKIASPEMNHYALWDALGNDNVFVDNLFKLTSDANPKSLSKRSIYFSCGVKKIQDIEHLFDYLRLKNMLPSAEIDYILLHCLTQYPAPESEYNLWTLKRLEDTYHAGYGIHTGLSDHTVDPYFLPTVACALKALYGKPFVLEKHFTLDKQSGGLDDAIAIEPLELKKLCHQLKEVHAHFINHALSSSVSLSKSRWQRRLAIKIITSELANISKIDDAKNYSKARIQDCFGNGKKKLARAEKKNYRTTNRSLLAMKNIVRGEKLKVASSLVDLPHANVSYLRAEKNKRPGFDYRYYSKISQLIARA